MCIIILLFALLRGEKSLMCGFTGYIHGKLEINHKKTINDMLEVIKHRGPDSRGIYTDDSVTLGFQRLSILDLSNAANQPLKTDDEEVVMVFNGEIYNFQEIRQELESFGFTFVTSSDSEVILKGYQHYGIAILEKLRGMFAFAIWDKKANTTYIARDIFGIKPLYYTNHTTDGTILFGSEIKSFLHHPSFIKELNENALRPYLTYQYSVLDETFFKEVYKLKPGHYMTIKDGDITIQQYFTTTFNDTERSVEEVVKDIENVMEQSVQKHLVSDVKVGSFLSGGIDSSYIAALAKPDQTFSVGFAEYEDMFDETKHAKDLSDILGTKNKRKYITAKECFDALPTIQWHMDEPQSNPSSVPLYFLSELAAKDVTVVLSGEGADELFGGYEWYRPSERINRYQKLPLFIRQLAAKSAPMFPKRYKDFLINGSLPVEKKFIGQAFVWNEKDAVNVLKPKYKNGPSVYDVVAPYYKEVEGKSDLSKMQYVDLNAWLPGDILLKADKMSMAHSIELRVPFLDKEVLKVASTIPPQLRTTKQETKIALRQAAFNKLPKEWAKRKKVGFPVPIRHWFKEKEYYELVKNTFSKSYVAEFFDQEQLISYLDQHYNGTNNYARYIWTVYVFCVWYEQFFPEKC